MYFERDIKGCTVLTRTTERFSKCTCVNRKNVETFVICVNNNNHVTFGDEHCTCCGGGGISKNYENRRHVSAHRHSIPINYITVRRCLHSSFYLTKMGVYAEFGVTPSRCSVCSPSLPDGELLLLLLLWRHAVEVLLHAVSAHLGHAVRRLLVAVVIRRRLRHTSVRQISRRVGRRLCGVQNSDGSEPWVESSHGDL